MNQPQEGYPVTDVHALINRIDQELDTEVKRRKAA
jgi:hypothetical protein